jgi:hypothetical protein
MSSNLITKVKPLHVYPTDHNNRSTNLGGLAHW